jgi:alkanesulfonate monooxygenase SsuD/methylene tetrahydromethanopterin reductase-like flavin-dependent oxidoreductase (luciferase family)
MAGVGEVRQPRGTAVALRDPLPWRAFAGAARLAEELGYEGVFLPEIAGRDALAALTGLAGETSRLSLGTGVIPMDSRAPMLTAMAAATVQERSGGRAILGIGTGAALPGALERLGALVGELRRLLDHELSLDLPAPVPIWISALGPRALRLAGTVADGVLLNWCPPERVAQARASVSTAVEAAGRDPSDVTVAVYVRASLGSDREAADLALRRAAGEYASYPAYARQFAAVGLEAEATAAAAAHRAGRPQDVPEALVRAIALPHDPAAAARRLGEYRDAGADLPVVYPVVAGQDPEASLTATIRVLAPA